MGGRSPRMSSSLVSYLPFNLSLLKVVIQVPLNVLLSKIQVPLNTFLIIVIQVPLTILLIEYRCNFSF